MNAAPHWAAEFVTVTVALNVPVVAKPWPALIAPWAVWVNCEDWPSPQLTLTVQGLLLPVLSVKPPRPNVWATPCVAAKDAGDVTTGRGPGLPKNSPLRRAESPASR